MGVKEALLALEEQGWQSLSNGTAARFYQEHLTEEAIMMLPIVGMLDRQSIIDGMESTRAWDWFRLEHVRLLPLGDTSATLAYTATAGRKDRPEYRALMSSTYVRSGNTWKLAFHQQTPLP